VDDNRARAREAAAIGKSDQLDRWQAYAEAMLAYGFDLGRGLLLDYGQAYQLGHDTGLGARQDTRAMVRGILDGYSAGCRARHELIAELLGKGERCDHHNEATRPPPGPKQPTPSAAMMHSGSPSWSARTPPAESAETGSKPTSA
jgi:hypothetical protein